MCGIFGTIGLSVDEKEVFRALAHRGPDERGRYLSERIDMFHVRLSIVGLSCGQQPMTIGSYTIVYNGEFYNHEAIRQKYKLECHTESDTETLLKFYILRGEACFDEIDGMFALAIYDKASDSLLLARDRAGKKPLYIYRKNSAIVFSSELNAISAVTHLDIDHKHINAYLSGCLYGSRTSFKGVSELNAGSICRIDCASLAVDEKRWWRIEDGYYSEKENSLEDCVSELDTALMESVKSRLLQSDLEVGAFLSGGIDSGIVTAMAASTVPKIKSFTVAFDGEFDESGLAKHVAQKYRTDHHEIRIDFNSLQHDFEGIVSAYGEPFSDSSAIPSYYVAEAAKQYVSVVLNGDGADEVFGGYRRYVPFAKLDLYERPEYVRNLAKIIRKMLPLPGSKKSRYNYVYRLLNLLAANKRSLYWYATTDVFTGYEKYFLSEHPVERFDDLEEILLTHENLTSIEKAMILDFNILLQGVLLVKMDIATMQHSLEARSPFLSKSVLELGPRISNSLKVKGGTTKLVLRELSKKYLPEIIVDQPKRGFEIPLKAWVNSDRHLKPLVYDLLGTSGCFSSEFVSYNLIEELLNKPNKFASEKRAKMLYRLLVLEVWYKKQKLVN